MIGLAVVILFILIFIWAIATATTPPKPKSYIHCEGDRHVGDVVFDSSIGRKEFQCRKCVFRSLV